MNFRSERVGKLIREELSKMILREVELPALATITEVDVDKKLDAARVKVSVIPASAEKEVLAELTKNAGHFQYLMLRKINIKPMPRIFFEIDHGFENAALVEKLLGQDTIKAQEEEKKAKS
ncbi:MAG TPA: ribosome-binding factor A [Candidatus Paceibacterota bacterium]|nr:ribosome-binding factor A [Candidatus Paceibacterota bacterium]